MLEQNTILVHQPLCQPRIERLLLGSGESETARVDGDDHALDASFGIGRSVRSGGTDRQRAGRRHVFQPPARDVTGKGRAPR